MSKYITYNEYYNPVDKWSELCSNRLEKFIECQLPSITKLMHPTGSFLENIIINTFFDAGAVCEDLSSQRTIRADTKINGVLAQIKSANQIVMPNNRMPKSFSFSKLIEYADLTNVNSVDDIKQYIDDIINKLTSSTLIYCSIPTMYKNNNLSLYFGEIHTSIFNSITPINRNNVKINKKSFIIHFGNNCSLKLLKGGENQIGCSLDFSTLKIYSIFDICHNTQCPTLVNKQPTQKPNDIQDILDAIESCEQTQPDSTIVID